MKKILIFSSVVITLFIGIAAINFYKNAKAIEDNPYNKSNLHPETVKLLDDPNYQNLILPEELENKLSKDDVVTVYFYSPLCTYCVKMTPMISPFAKEIGVDLVQYNIYEFKEGWDKYKIDSTPTIVHYENGKEVARIVGGQPKEKLKKFFDTNLLN
ncbi:thioredoxin family protein [Bacillus sp. 2205SS5-2]|uniref:thioredoxin family protein n=1 Tax=Bacillus sp. 2205SS5-2 TaxID=3109031 RepID=UPI0030048D16